MGKEVGLALLGIISVGALVSLGELHSFVTFSY